MHIIKIENSTIRSPSHYGELSLPKLMRILSSMYSGNSFQSKLIYITMILLGIPENLKNTYLWLFHTDPESRLDISRCTEFIFQKPNLTKNKLFKITITRLWKKNIHLYGPLDKLRKIVFLEFIKAETYYLNFHRAYKEAGKVNKAATEALNKLVAVLYRPRKKIEEMDERTFNGDIRIQYNDDLVDQRVQLVSRLPQNVKLAILIFYTSCRDLLIKDYEHLYPKLKAKSGENAEGGSWVDALYGLADGALNMEKVGMLDARLALMDLDRRIAAQKERELWTK